MNCLEVKRKLSPFQDKALPESEMENIEKHLNECPECSRAFHELTDVWNVLSQVETIDSAPFFWTRLSHRLKEKDAKQNIRKLVLEPVPKFAFSMLTIFVLFFGLFIGIYLGQNIYQHSQLSNLTNIEEEIDQALPLNSFDDFPQESVADVYVTILSENNNH